MKNRKKFLLLIIGLLIYLLVFVGVQIYAKYLSSYNGNTSVNVARWNIKVNNTSIKDGSNLSSSLVPVFPGNEHIASNIIAPTAEGYFDLNIDSSEADVSFKFDITTSVSPDSSVSDLVVTAYSVDDGPKNIISDASLPISDTILLSSVNKNKKIRIYILWNDDEATQKMTNADDFLSTTSANPALLDVKINFTQVIS